jgi:hypothetical protein
MKGPMKHSSHPPGARACDGFWIVSGAGCTQNPLLLWYHDGKSSATGQKLVVIPLGHVEGTKLRVSNCPTVERGPELGTHWWSGPASIR